MLPYVYVVTQYVQGRYLLGIDILTGIEFWQAQQRTVLQRPKHRTNLCCQLIYARRDLC